MNKKIKQYCTCVTFHRKMWYENGAIQTKDIEENEIVQIVKETKRYIHFKPVNYDKTFRAHRLSFNRLFRLNEVPVIQLFI